MHLYPQNPRGSDWHSGKPLPGAHGKLYPLMDSMNSWLELAWASCLGDERKAESQAGHFPDFKPSLHLGRWPYIPSHRMLMAALTFKGGWLLIPGVLPITVLVDSSMSP